jgi:replicative DNA helicase
MVDITEDTSLEHSIIGACCIDIRVLDRVGVFLTVDDFTIEACARIYDAALDARSRGKTFDSVLAADAISALIDDANGFVMSCMDLCPTCSNAEHHAELLHQRAEQRRFREAVISALGNESAAADVSGICSDYLRRNSGGRLQPLAAGIEDVFDRLDHPEEGRLNTGFPRLDGLLKGLGPGQLIVVGARPGVGKSAFALDLAEHTARAGKKVLLASLEMLRGEIAERLLARRSGVPLDRMIDGNPSEGQRGTLDEIKSKLAGLPVMICDDPSISVARLRGMARSISGLQLVVVDYLQLLTPSRRSENRVTEITAISRDLKLLAQELRVPVVALSQLSRAQDAGEEPGLTSLRDSGSIEQDSDKVILLWSVDADLGVIGCKIAKNRRGQMGAVQFDFDGSLMKFTERSNDIPTARKRRTGGFLGGEAS